MSIPSQFGLSAIWIWLVSSIATGTILWLVVGFRARHREAELRPPGPQHIHIGSTSRLGGLGVFIGFVLAVAIALGLEFIPLHPLLLLQIAALPVFVVGLWEDITHRASPRIRILGAAISAALASALAQGVITRLDLPFVDAWLTYLPFALPLTWFMVVGACNAFNIIDGTNGLAGGSALLMFAGMTIVAWHVGDMLVLVQSVAMTGHW